MACSVIPASEAPLLVYLRMSTDLLDGGSIPLTGGIGAFSAPQPDLSPSAEAQEPLDLARPPYPQPNNTADAWRSNAADFPPLTQPSLTSWPSKRPALFPVGSAPPAPVCSFPAGCLISG